MLFPEFEKSLLGMRVHNAITFPPAELHCCADDLTGEARVSTFISHGKPFKLGKIRKIPNAHATNGLLAVVTNQVGCGEIIAVELFLERAMLLTHIDRAADRDHARH